MSNLTREYVSPASTGTAHKTPIAQDEAKCPIGYKKVLLGDLHNASKMSGLAGKVTIVYFVPYFDDIAEMPRINRVEGIMTDIARYKDIQVDYIAMNVVSTDFV